MTANNAEDTITETIDSVLKQSFFDFEFIIVNDGLTNNTRSMIDSYNDKRIRLIDNGNDYIQSLNMGMMVSTGKYIARINAGDIMHIDRLKLQYSMMEEFHEIIVCSSWETVFGEKMPKKISNQKSSGLIVLPLVQLLLDNIIISPTYTIRRSFITKNHLFYENYPYAEDYKYWVEIAKFKGSFYIDSQPLVYKRISDTEISKSSCEELQSISKIKKEILNFICTQYNEAYPALMTLYNSYYELLEQELISENDIFSLFYSIFTKNKETFKSLTNSQE